MRALAFISGAHTVTIADLKIAAWNPDIDFLELSYNGRPFELFLTWASTDESHSMLLTRTYPANALHMVVREKLGVELAVVPVGEEESN